MKNRLSVLLGASLVFCASASWGANVVVTTEDNGNNAGAAGTFYWALTNCNPGDTITFNIPGTGTHYLKPPAGGFPLLYRKHNVTINGYSQPGSSPNTAAITTSNNAVIKIVLDGRAGVDNYTDMAYVYYGTLHTSVPAIDNSQLYGDGSNSPTGHERGGYDPDSLIPYAPGEVAILGIYRSTNVTIRGLALIGPGIADDGYLMAVAQDFGYDTAIKERYAYDNGTCRGFHVAGCWFGIDPGTGLDSGGGLGIAMFRHRDRNQTPVDQRRPSVLTDPNDEGVPNGENSSIGVAPGAASPRAEFNVFSADLQASIGAELCRTRISGNQFFSATDIGRYSDERAMAMLFGTDGDGINDADEGNLFNASLSVYNTRNKNMVIAGNTFNLELDGTRKNVYMVAIDGLGLDQGSQVRIGSDFNGVSDALEKNRIYDGTFSVGVGGSAAANASWLSLRGNELVNCVAPAISPSQLAFWGKFMDVDTLGSARPVLEASSTVRSLVGTCPTNRAPYSHIILDVYVADPEGDIAADPQGKTYLKTFEDNGPGDANPAPGAFALNITSLGLPAGTKLTVTATYAYESRPSFGPVSIAGTNVSYEIHGGVPTYGVLRSSAITGPWSSLALTTATNGVVPTVGGTSFYRVSGLSFAQGTSPFADSVALAP